MEERCIFLFTDEILSHIQVFNDSLIRVDVHGLTKNQAIRLLENLIAMNRNDTFTIEVVHGYRHGTAIKEAIYSELHTKKSIRKISHAYNKGITFLAYAAA